MHALSDAAGHRCEACTGLAGERGLPSKRICDCTCRFLSTVEAYDPRADAWRPLTALDAPRAYCAAATVNGGAALQQCWSQMALYL